MSTIYTRSKVGTSRIFILFSFHKLQFDTDRDGHLDIHEMKRLIRRHQCEQIPKGIARQILEMHDTNNDERLDFEEFYALSQEHEWLFKGFLIKYCRMIVPSPHREGQDETGES